MAHGPEDRASATRGYLRRSRAVSNFSGTQIILGSVGLIRAFAMSRASSLGRTTSGRSSYPVHA